MTGRTRTGRETGTSPASFWRILRSPATLATYALLVVPFAVGWFETSWTTPLALPGYLIYVIGSAIGNAISPRLALRIYWVPFLVGCYGIAVVVGYGYDRVRVLRSR